MQLKHIFENYNTKINNNRKKPKTIWRRVQCGEDNSNTIRVKISVQKKKLQLQISLENPNL